MTASFKIRILSSLHELSKFLMLNGSFVKNPGLLEGEIGSAIFLYHYESYIDNALLFNLCNELILRNIQKINKHELSYERGAAGIAWTISYLGKKDFIEVPTTDMFANIDTLIIKNCSVDVDLKSLGISFYILSSLGEMDLFDDPHRELTYLLKKERLIAQVDKIQSEHVVKKLSIQIMSVKDYINENNLTILRDKIEEICVVSVFLKRIYLTHIYPEVVGKLLNESYDAILILIKRFFEISTYVPISYEQTRRFEFLVIRLYAVFFEISTLLLKNTYENDLIEFVNKIGLKAVRWSKFKPVPLDSSYITGLSSLNQINSRLSSDSLSQSLTKRIEKEIFPEIESGRLFNSFNNRSGCNIGVAGIAGLGLNLLQLLEQQVNGWEESIIIS